VERAAQGSKLQKGHLEKELFFLFTSNISAEEKKEKKEKRKICLDVAEAWLKNWAERNRLLK